MHSLGVELAIREANATCKTAQDVGDHDDETSYLSAWLLGADIAWTSNERFPPKIFTLGRQLTTCRFEIPGPMQTPPILKKNHLSGLRMASFKHFHLDVSDEVAAQGRHPARGETNVFVEVFDDSNLRLQTTSSGSNRQYHTLLCQSCSSLWLDWFRAVRRLVLAHEAGRLDSKGRSDSEESLGISKGYMMISGRDSDDG